MFYRLWHLLVAIVAGTLVAGVIIVIWMVCIGRWPVPTLIMSVVFMCVVERKYRYRR